MHRFVISIEFRVLDADREPSRGRTTVSSAASRQRPGAAKAPLIVLFVLAIAG